MEGLEHTLRNTDRLPYAVGETLKQRDEMLMAVHQQESSANGWGDRGAHICLLREHERGEHSNFRTLLFCRIIFVLFFWVL